jgi:2-polyprenyl-3-methyl-5-hydroxy-6-metoxy-1,4-benzoquinol methylase
MKEKNISRFDADTTKMGGYVYTKNNRLSSYLANLHQTLTTLKLVNIKGKTVIDIGCGDGTYTQEWFRIGKPKSIFAFDPSKKAISTANKNNKYKSRVKYAVGSIYKMPTNKTYDIAIVRGVLHHLYSPEKGMEQISKIARTVILIEPNGYNLILKIIEKTSPYHIEHEEKSYAPHRINGWIRRFGGKIKRGKFAAIVPFFCPDWMAKILKGMEPTVESLGIINWFFCSNYYVVYQNKRD